MIYSMYLKEANVGFLDVLHLPFAYRTSFIADVDIHPSQWRLL